MVCSKHFKTTASMSQELKRVLTRVGKNENFFRKELQHSLCEADVICLVWSITFHSLEHGPIHCCKFQYYGVK